MRIQLRSTILKEFAECQKRVYWMVIRELNLKNRPEYFNIGSLTHEGLKVILHPKFKSLPIAQRIPKAIEHAKLYAKNENIPEPLLNEALTYIYLYGNKEPDKNIDMFSVEQSFSIILKDTKETRITYGTTLDGLGRDKQREDLVYIEHKTTSGYGPVYAESIEKSAQISGAIYCGQENLKEKIDLVFVNYIVKTKTPRLERGQVLMNDNRLEIWHRETLKEADKFEKCLRSGIWNMNQHSCCQFRKNKCSYMSLCWFGENERTLSQFKKRKIGKPTDKVLVEE